MLYVVTFAGPVTRLQYSQNPLNGESHLDVEAAAQPYGIFRVCGTMGLGL